MDLARDDFFKSWPGLVTSMRTDEKAIRLPVRYAPLQPVRKSPTMACGVGGGENTNDGPDPSNYGRLRGTS